ncbi:MAG: BatD family protein, partial [Mariprofundus sp.]|nr:BatD family protein [Mariprofundus sp.]
MVGQLRWVLIILVCMMGWSISALAAVTAHVDRFNISEGETVNLSIEVTGDDSGDPQTAPLQKDFEILSNNHSSSFSIVNGSTSSKSVYQLMLMPRHAGPLTIPAIKVGSAATTPIMIQVSKVQTRTTPAGQPTGDVWLSMDISPKQLRVQQQAIITIRVYQAVGLNQAQLTEPKAEHAVIERLGDDASYQKRENNRSWQVTERHYALFPQQSGHIDIAPVQLDGSALVGSGAYFQTARPIRVRSNALSLEVAGIPAGWSGDDWLPAKQVSLEESWPQSGTKLRVGEPITRTLTLR